MSIWLFKFFHPFFKKAFIVYTIENNGIVSLSYALFYSGSALSRRIRDREREIESDERDRKKEKEEVEELRRRLQEEYPDKDPDELIAKLNKAEESGSDDSPDSTPTHSIPKPLMPNLSEISLPAQIAEPPSRGRSATPNLPPAPPATIIIKQPAMKAVPTTVPTPASGPVFGFQMKSKSVSNPSLKTTIEMWRNVKFWN